MTREQCKDLLVEKIASLGGVRSDELVAWSLLYTIDGFSNIFHPDLLKQLVAERRILTIEYTLPEAKTSHVFLLPIDTNIKVFNGRVSL